MFQKRSGVAFDCGESIAEFPDSAVGIYQRLLHTNQLGYVPVDS